ncbi:MAG TPA: hypothetical protein DDX91_02450 [Ruminococcaceae bacterium]|nr:hypothetical protein [Oscillospiraceae bacterium]
MEKEVLTAKYQSVSLNVTANKIDSYRRKDEIQNTVRVYDSGKIGIAGSLGDLDENALTEEAKKALDYGIEYPCKLDSTVKTVDKSKEIVKLQNFIPQMQRLLDRLAVECPKFAVSNKIKLQHHENTYKNSMGADLLSLTDFLTMTLIFQDKGSGNLFDCCYEGDIIDYDEDQVIADCKKMYDAFYNPVDIEEGEYPVFMVSDRFFYTVGRHLCAPFYASGGSLVGGKLGERIFNEKLTCCNDKNPESNPYACFFDDEGQTAPDNYRQPLIKDGVLTNVLTCKGLSQSFDLPDAATGTADYDGVPSFGYEGVWLKPTAQSAFELAPERGVLAVMASGGDMTPDGHYATPLQLSYLVEKGEIVGRLPDISVSGNFFELLGNDYLGAVQKPFFPSLNENVMAFRMKVGK